MSARQAHVWIAVAICLAPACGRVRYDPIGGGDAAIDATRDAGDAASPPPGDYFIYVAADNEIHVFAPSGPDRVPVASAPPTPGAAMPRAFAPHPSGRFLFVMDSGPMCDDLYGYAVDPVDGSLSLPGAPTLIGVFQPESRLLAAPGGDALYVTADGVGTVNLFQFRVDPASGSVTPFEPPAVITGGTPGQLAMTPDRRFVYVANTRSNDVSRYTAGADGALTWIEDVATCAGTRGIAPHPTVPALYVACAGSGEMAMFPFDAATGAIGASPVPPRQTGGARAVAVDPTGRFLLVLDDVGERLLSFAIDDATGVPGTTPAVAATGPGPVDLALSPDGTTAYVAHATPSELRTYTLASTGPRPAGPPVAAGADGRAVSVLPL